MDARDDRQIGHMTLLCLREQEAHRYLSVLTVIAQGFNCLDIKTLFVFEFMSRLFCKRTLIISKLSESSEGNSSESVGGFKVFYP